MSLRVRAGTFLAVLAAWFTAAGFGSAQDLVCLLGTSPLRDGRCQTTPAVTPDQGPWSLAILSDLHVQADNLAACRQLVDAVNARPGATATALLGDVCGEVGSPAELGLASQELSRLRGPLHAVAGNHDFLYADDLGADGKKRRGTRAEKAAKLERYRAAFKQERLGYSLKQGGHLLVFLPVDSLDGRSIVTLSEQTLRFLEGTLEANRGLPTVVFCHAPLEGSCEAGQGSLSSLNGYAQPADRLESLLRAHPQVFLWVAGHRHVKPSSPSFNAPCNRVGGVTVVHVPNVTSAGAWFLTLDVAPGTALVRCFDAASGRALVEHDRRFVHAATVL